MKKLLIFDCDGICWAVFHALGTKLSHNNIGTSIIYGFLNHIFATQSHEKADCLVFAWDSHSSKSLRKQLFPEYKLKRSIAKNEYTEEEKLIHAGRSTQFRLVKEEILPALGFSNVFWQDGYEGDDIIASIVLSYKDRYSIKMVTRDQDMYQLIDDTVTMYDPVKGKIISRKIIKDTYGIEPHQFREVKAIYGCATDEVPGIRGVGETKAIQYVKGEMKYTSKVYKTIVSSSSVIDFTRRLVVLPFDGTNQFKIKPDTCQTNKIKSVARKFGLKSFTTLQRCLEYRRNFCGYTEEEPNRENTRGVGTTHNNLLDF